MATNTRGEENDLAILLQRGIVGLTLGTIFFMIWKKNK
jgi:hypothetical protein